MIAGESWFSGGGVCEAEWLRLAAWECPEGWLSVTPIVGDPDVPESIHAFGSCEPPPLPESCSAGELRLSGQTACVRMGAACPDGFPSEEDIRAAAGGAAGTIVYVDAEAGADGVGSEAAPFRTINEGIRASAAGDIVALAGGTYSEFVLMPGELALVGACASAVRIEAPEERSDIGVLTYQGRRGGRTTRFRCGCLRVTQHARQRDQNGARCDRQR